MRELFRSNDLVRLSWAQSVLTDAGIRSIVLDAHISAAEGLIGAFPRRLVVEDEDYTRATRTIAESEKELPP